MYAFPTFSKYFPNYFQFYFQCSLWLPITFQTTSKILQSAFKGLKDKATMSLLRRDLPRHSDQFSSETRTYLLWLSERWFQTPPNSVNYDSRERLFLQTDGLLRRLTAKACCINVERPCGAIGRSRLAWGQSLTLLFRDSFRDFALKRYK